ncbi:hypothetical protein CDAR_494851 [Caerostris darwini]|uniref:Secreted protein n=1 Tax=Caerostris darwini TaxID=1538125 RepID=A0AAV4PYB2_9ARAC|nr:hypothetical protein CDAR_494851 [Caerostris darwini]
MCALDSPYRPLLAGLLFSSQSNDDSSEISVGLFGLLFPDALLIRLMSVRIEKEIVGLFVRFPPALPGVVPAVWLAKGVWFRPLYMLTFCQSVSPSAAMRVVETARWRDDTE